MMSMTQIVQDLADQDMADPTALFAANISRAAALTGFVGSIAPPSIVVTAPISFAAAFAKWVFDVYRQTPSVIRCLMGYIIDLTCIMQKVYWRMRAKGGIQSMTNETLIEASQEFYKKDAHAIHNEIRVFVSKPEWSKVTNKDLVLDEVIRLIEKYRIHPDGAHKVPVIRQ